MANAKVPFSKPNIGPLSNVNGNEIIDIISSGWVSNSKSVRSLEEYFQNTYNVKHAIACSNATTGLIISVKAAGWKNRRISLPAFTWPSTLYALECNGNYASFRDIDKDTWTINWDGVEDATDFLPMDTFGVDSSPVTLKTEDRCIFDAAHFFGHEALGQRGLAEVVSFSFTKSVTAMEGGMILTNDDNFAEVARELRRLSGRMGEINAYVALQSIKYYWTEAVYQISDNIQYYKENIKCKHKLQKSVLGKSTGSVFAVMFETPHIRNQIMAALAAEGFETKAYYEPLVDGLPNTDYVYNRILALPTYPNITTKLPQICDIINRTAESSVTPGKRFMGPYEGIIRSTVL